MKIRIHDFGPINEFSFDLSKDWNLILGENNVGKSYAITLIYLIIKTFLNVDLLRLSFRRVMYSESEEVSIIENKLNKVINDLPENGSSDISKLVNEDIISILEESYLDVLSGYLKSTFGQIEYLSCQYTKKPFVILISTEMTTFKITSDKNILKISSVKLGKKFYLKGTIQNRKPHKSKDKYIIYANSTKKQKNELVKNYLELVFSITYEILMYARGKYSNVHYLPASRSGLYQALSAFGQIAAEWSKKRSLLTSKIELPGISIPLSDYFLTLSEIKIRKMPKKQDPIREIASKIENDLLQGSVEFDTKTKRLIYSPRNTSIKLDLSYTSSMVSELSPIVAYLRYVLVDDDDTPDFMKPFYFKMPKAKDSQHIIFIEEPEAHLHPKIQLLITGIFSDLVKNKVKVVITTHSNFIFNKMNNLILSKDIDITNCTSMLLKYTPYGSISSILPLDELGVEDENFIEPTEEIFLEKTNLLTKLSEK